MSTNTILNNTNSTVEILKEVFSILLQSLIGDIEKGMKTLHNYHQIWKQFGFTPEFYKIPNAEAQSNREGYPLRPGKLFSLSYIESLFDLGVYEAVKYLSSINE